MKRIEVTVSRSIPASPAEVFDVCLDPKHPDRPASQDRGAGAASGTHVGSPASHEAWSARGKGLGGHRRWRR
jgi:hypothetical protein